MNIVSAGYDSTNYYVINIRGGKLLVDCGWPGTLPKFRTVLKRKGIGLEEIRYLLVTHFHPDHAGLAQEIKDAGAELILMENQPDFIPAMEELFKRKRLTFSPITAERSILLGFAESRTFLARLRIEGEIIPTPGHTPDSVSLILDKGLAFIGDLHPILALPVDDEVSRLAWARIYEHGISRIYPAHGESWAPAW